MGDGYTEVGYNEAAQCRGDYVEDDEWLRLATEMELEALMWACQVELQERLMRDGLQSLVDSGVLNASGPLDDPATKLTLGGT